MLGTGVSSSPSPRAAQAAGMIHLLFATATASNLVACTSFKSLLLVCSLQCQLSINLLCRQLGRDMDMLVYEDSPLAEYLEGQAVPFEIPQEPTPPQPSFAPQGLPNFRDRLRNIRSNATSIQPTSSEKILEQFHYIIVASQLLTQEAPPRRVDNEKREPDKSLLQGTIATAVLSFVTAWTLHWLRSRKSALKSLSWLELGTYCLASFCVGVAVLLFSRHHYSKYIQKQAADSLTRLVNDSHTFDSTANGTLRFIQEVECVARGYDLSSPLPPISHLEEKSLARRCQNLRSQLVTTLTLLITLYVESHNALQSFVVQQDLQRYHDIYDISLAEYSEAIRIANESTEEAKCALRELRFALRLHAVARKVFLCDLLTLRTTRGWHRVRQWRSVLTILREIEEETWSRQQILSTQLHNEEYGLGTEQRRTQRGARSVAASPVVTTPTESQQYKMQMRRFEDVAHGIRALNAKMHVLREEISGLNAAKTDEVVVLAALSKHYESLGTDIRALQYDWERGRNTMLLSAMSGSRVRAGSISPRSPISPSPSLGGFTVVDGGPADALRFLNGDDRSSRSSDSTLYDEEVYEAKSTPRKRTSTAASMTREEKIAKLNEDRRKRATLQEQAETTTNMLRELQMVIKHRPHTRSPSTPTGFRIATL